MYAVPSILQALIRFALAGLLMICLPAHADVTYRVSYLKIAQSFIDAAADDTERATTMRAIANFARELGIGVIAQGVETAEQRDLSRATSTIAQGWYFGKAMGAPDVTELLRVGLIAPLTDGRSTAVAARDERAPHDGPPVLPFAA